MENIRVLNPRHTRGRLTHALFDFDGTISLIRCGWEEVMQALMEEMITGRRDRLAGADLSRLRNEISRYIDESTGILTIHQMQWLEEAVRRWGLNATVLSAREYKRLYNERLLEEKVNARIAGGEGEECGKGEGGGSLLVGGARAFLRRLRHAGVELTLASGTDDVYVRREADFLGVSGFFGRRIHGALDDTEEYTKENIIRRILDRIGGESGEPVPGRRNGGGGLLAVFGDGPVEIRAAKEHGALAVGVASDERTGEGWNPRKIRRLTDAGADILIPDFVRKETLLTALQE